MGSIDYNSLKDYDVFHFLQTTTEKEVIINWWLLLVFILLSLNNSWTEEKYVFMYRNFIKEVIQI